MKFGVCIGGDHTKIAVSKKLGYDYVESCFSLLADEDEAPYDQFRAALIENDIPCLSVNCFLPSSLPVTGPSTDYAALTAYVERGMRRGAALGVKTVVFGSGGARRLPDGFPYEEGIGQLVYFLSEIVSPIAEKYDITVVIEPLSPKDTNVINSIKEGAILSCAVHKPNIRLLGDVYHMCNVGDTNEDVVRMKGLLRHAHIAEPTHRAYPTESDAFDYKSFVDALTAAGCEHCSLEAGCRSFEEEAAAAIAVFKKL